MQAAAKYYGFPYHTFRNRCKGLHKATQDAHDGQMLLGFEEEEELSRWIRSEGLFGRPVTTEMLRLKVKELADQFPSRGWFIRFQKRHPELRRGRAAGLDPERADAMVTHLQHG